MGHHMGHAAFSSIRFTQFRVYMMLPEHAVYIIGRDAYKDFPLLAGLAAATPTIYTC